MIQYYLIIVNISFSWYNSTDMHSNTGSAQIKTTALLWVMVAGLCAVVANVVAAGMM